MRSSELLHLNTSWLLLADERQDIRYLNVFDRRCKEIGYVSDVFLDCRERKIRMLEIRAAGSAADGERHVLLPVDAITAITRDEVHVDVTRARLVHSPAYDPNRAMPPIKGVWEPYYGYYGLAPFWCDDYAYPAFAFMPLQRAGSL